MWQKLIPLAFCLWSFLSKALSTCCAYESILWYATYFCCQCSWTRRACSNFELPLDHRIQIDRTDLWKSFQGDQRHPFDAVWWAAILTNACRDVIEIDQRRHSIASATEAPARDSFFSRSHPKKTKKLMWSTCAEMRVSHEAIFITTSGCLSENASILPLLRPLTPANHVQYMWHQNWSH